ITGNDDAAIGAVILGLVCISIGISQFLLHHEVLPHASYVPHDRSLLSKGSRFPVLWWLIPESQWSPPMVVRRYHPLLTSRCRAHCWTAVMDTLLTCLLSVVAALGVGGDLSSCFAALIVVALLFFVYGIALAVLRAHRLPMDRLVFPFIQWGYGVLCVLKLFDVAESIGEAIQLVVSVLQMWQVGWSFWVFFVERSLAAAACGSAGDDDGSSANSEELTKLQCGPQLSDVWLDSTHARTVLHVDAEAPLFPFFPPLSEIADDEAKFWSPDGLAVLHERGSHDSPLLMQRSVSLADSSMLDEILESIGREG
ncbi:DGF-1-like protein, putative, partial [Bodo saltans]